ncbi:hypothetical protein GALMADRAFT_244048 [Galerina marginata CBS 339.88]|uniref:DUF4139 domain-containing protein n=1 Tax=Galerina marginata (strain CBS 339.88) TaxID=685588 RepID=A0A067TFC5_GALM3|nr:hypothetical protein GALMADRAFT_244048 [Galerina marginata CBS 339.88]
MASTLTIQASDHAIKSVTVFKSQKAEVARTFTLDLKKGQNKVEIRGLSSSIDTHSVRVSGLGDARLFDVVCTLGNNKAASYAPESSSEVIRTLLVKKAGLESERAVRQQESQLLLKYAETLNGEHVTPTQMAAFLESYVDRGRKTLQAATQLNEQIVQITRQIDAEQEKAAAKRGSTLGRVDIVIFADAENSVELKLTYIVSNVQWKPTYELHATTDNGKPSSSVALHYRARVTQGTGEDWNNTSLTLNTVASDLFVKKIPQLRPVKLQPGAQRSTFVPSKPAMVMNNFVNSNVHGARFGNNQNQQNQQQQQQSKPFNGNTNLFGQPQAATGTSIFGSTATNSGAAFGGGGAFGAPNVQPSTNLFGAPPAQSTAFGGGGGGGFSGFGAPAAQASTSLFGAAPAHSTIGTGLFGTTVPLGGAPAFGFGPAPAPVTVDPVLIAQYEAELAAAEAMPLPEDDDDLGGFEAVDGPANITEPTTVVSETPIAVSFSVHGESTIPSDGVDHQVSVAVLPFEAKISYICIPRIDPRVFLQCEVKNSSEYRLLSGPVTVILDDSYVSKTSINDINTGDNFECTLGDDASTKVTYSRSGKTVKSDEGTFSEVTNSTTYTTKISIHNKHQFDITDLIVREVIPTSDDKRAKVILRKPAGLAGAKDGAVVDLKNDGLKVGWEPVVDSGKGGEKEGRFEWKWKVGSGAKVNLEAEWEIKVPGETPWVEASVFG